MTIETRTIGTATHVAQTGTLSSASIGATAIVGSGTNFDPEFTTSDRLIIDHGSPEGLHSYAISAVTDDTNLTIVGGLIKALAGGETPFKQGTLRNYSTITSWEAAIDNTTYPSAGTDVLGECYNDSAFDEVVTIDADVTNVDSITLSVAAGERHDGTAGTGTRVVRTGATAVVSLSSALGAGTGVIEWLEIDKNGQTDAGVECTFGSTNTFHWAVKNCIIHGKDGSVVRGGIHGGASAVVALNNIVYDWDTSTGSGDNAGIFVQTNRSGNLFNNTVHDIRHSQNALNRDAFCFTFGDIASLELKNNIGTDPTSGASGTNACYSISSPSSAVVDYNLASDDSDSGANSIGADDGVVTTDQFESIMGGSEDLHLKSGADAIDAGMDLGVVPAGVEIDIDGWNRDSDSPSRDPWDMGAHEFEPPPVGGNEGAAMYHHLQNIGAY